MTRIPLIGMVAWLALVNQVPATEFHVDPAVAWASDNNPGTLARPWKTVGRAATVAMAGDTVFIHAGVYLESVRVPHDGKSSAPITFKAFADDQVVMDGADPVPTGKWRLAPGTHDIYATPAQQDPGQVLIDGKPCYVKVDLISKGYPRKYRRGVLTDADKNEYQYNSSTKSVLLNLGGDAPAKHDIRMPVRAAGFEVGSHITLIGIRFSHYQNAAVFIQGDTSVVQDCVARECNQGIVVAGWNRRGVVLRRNTIIDAFSNGILLVDRPTQCIVEDNLAIRCTLNPAHNEDWMGSIKMNSAADTVFANNVVLEAGNPDTDQGHDGAALWGDINVSRVVYKGNTCANNKSFGLYVEHGMADTTAYFNCLYRDGQGIGCRESQRGMFMYNLILESRGPGFALWPGQLPYPTEDNLFAHNLVRACNPALLFQTSRPNFVDYNTYWLGKDGHVADALAGQPPTPTAYQTLTTWAQATGHDTHSQVRDLQPADAGLDTVTFRAPDAKDSNGIVMMVGNSGCECDDPGGQTVLPYFWRPGPGDGSEHPFSYAAECGLRGGIENLGYHGAGATIALHADEESVTGAQKVAHGGLRCLQITGQRPADMCAEGLGFWSPSLSVRSGDTFAISFFVRGRYLYPLAGNAVAGFCEFSNETGQHRHRIALNCSPPGSPSLTGSFEWIQLSSLIKVPTDSQRMRVFLGMYPRTGLLWFDDISVKVR